MSDTKKGFNPFNDSGTNIIMPTVTDVVGEDKSKGKIEVMSEGTEEAISGEVVKSMILKEHDDVELPNFVINITDIDQTGELQLDAIKSMLHPEGNTAIYLYSKKAGMLKLGYGLQGLLDKLLNIVTVNIFGEKCSIYSNFEVGKKAKVITGSNIVIKRMNL